MIRLKQVNETPTTINTALDSLEISAAQSDDSTSTRYSLAEEIAEDEAFPSTRHKQAGLLLRKGYDNEKFISPIASRLSELAYEIVHHPVYLWFNFLTGVALLLLAIEEYPSVPEEQNILNGIVAAELVLLLFLALNLIMRLLWLEPKLFIRSRGTIMVIIISVMFIEAIVILARQHRHMRFSRAFRPVLLLDTFLMSGVRRVVRQIFLCLKYVFDVLLILFFLISIFGVMGYFFFAQSSKLYFENLERSFVSVLITFTTANHPDVFLEAYSKSRVAPLFFMVYMFVTFYYFSNVLLAVVFAKFKHAEKKKYRKLYLHRRKALKEAYNTLKGENGVHFIDFMCCIQQFQSRITTHEAMCVFVAIRHQPTAADVDTNVSRYIKWEEFSKLYNYIGLKWGQTQRGGQELTWYEDKDWISQSIRTLMKQIHQAVKHWLFDSIMSFIVILNLLFLMLSISLLDCPESNNSNTTDNNDTTEKNESSDDCNLSLNDQFCSIRHNITLIGSFVFLIVYLLEISSRLFLNGPFRYFRKRWNTIDFILVIGCFICLVIETVLIKQDAPSPCSPYYYELKYFAIARPLVLLRLMKLKRNYLYLIRIMIVLAERLVSVFFLLIIVYYFYAIIGMEVFSGEEHSVHANCCQDAWYGISEFYSNRSGSDSFFFLNTFNNLWSSYVTLYELMVVNNWFIIMEGFVSTTSSAARVYFILFWITTTLVVNTAIVYIVDAFESGLLALQIQEQVNNDSEDNRNDDMSDNEILESVGGDLKRVICLQFTPDDIDLMDQSSTIVTTPYTRVWLSLGLLVRRFKSVDISAIKKRKGEFRGQRIMNNDDLRQFLYSADIKLWKEEFDKPKKHTSVFSLRMNTSDSSYCDMFMDLMKYIWTITKKIVYYVLG